MGRARKKKRSASPASEEETDPAASSKRRIPPQVEVRIYRPPSPVICLDSSPTRGHGSNPRRSGSPISSVDASTPQSSESSQKSRHQDRYSIRSRMPVPTRSTRDIASDLIRTLSPELGDPIFHTPYERRVNQSKLTPVIASALHFLQRQDVAHFHRLNIDDVLMPEFGRLDINSICSPGYPSITHEKRRDRSEAADQEIEPEPTRQSEFGELPQRLQPSLDQVSVALEKGAVNSISSMDGFSSDTQCLEPARDPRHPHAAPEVYPGDVRDLCSTQDPIHCDWPIGNGIISTSDPDEQIPSTTLDGIPSAIWFWGRVRGHARYPNFDEDRFRRICREYVENMCYGFTDDKSDVKPERDSGDVHIIETRTDDDKISGTSTIVLEPSTKIGNLKQADLRHDVLLESNRSTVPHVSRSTSLGPSLDPSAQKVIQANVDLPFMRALGDEDSFDNILSRLDNASLINVAKATTLIPFSHLQRKYWNIDQAFVDCLGPRGHEFRRVLFETDALVTGPFALRFFSRLKTSQVAMDVFVPKEKYRTLVDHICHVHNFVRETYEGMCATTKQSVRDVLRSITRFAKAHMRISVFCTHEIPIQALFSLVSNSSLLNIISHDNAYCLFPRETFTNGRLRYFKDLDQKVVGPASASWEWQGTHLIEHDTSEITLPSPEFLGTRRVGDRYSWSMYFTALPAPACPDDILVPPRELERHTFQLESGSSSSCGVCSQGHTSKTPAVKHSHSPVINARVVSSLALNSRYLCATGPWLRELSSMCNHEIARQTDIAIQNNCLDVASMSHLNKSRVRDVLTGNLPDLPFDEFLRRHHDCIGGTSPPNGWRYADNDIIGWYEAWCNSLEQGQSKASVSWPRIASMSWPRIAQPLSTQLSKPFKTSRACVDRDSSSSPDSSHMRYSVLKHELNDDHRSGDLGFAISAGHDTPAAPRIKVEPVERPHTGIPIPPSRGFLRDMRDHGVARVPPPDGEWDAGVLFGSEPENESDGELPGGRLYEERRQIRIRLENEAAWRDPFRGLSKTQRRQRVRRLEEQRLHKTGHIQESSQAGMSDRALGKRPAR